MRKGDGFPERASVNREIDRTLTQLEVSNSHFSPVNRSRCFCLSEPRSTMGSATVSRRLRPSINVFASRRTSGVKRVVLLSP
jgi:hypothetical protein